MHVHYVDRLRPKNIYDTLWDHQDSYMISHKGIEHGIVTDAPFVGSRICAMTCHRNCPGCINRHMLGASYKVETVYDIIREVQANEISEGLILGGLEWTEQPYEMLWIIGIALGAKLKVILYTYHSIDWVLESFPELRGLKMYVKCGDYREDLQSYMDESNDVYLASNNQKIYNMQEF